jgi:hypothetical protein
MTVLTRRTAGRMPYQLADFIRSRTSSASSAFNGCAFTRLQGHGRLTAVSWLSAASCIAAVFGGGALAVSR